MTINILIAISYYLLNKRGRDCHTDINWFLHTTDSNESFNKRKYALDSIETLGRMSGAKACIKRHRDIRTPRHPYITTTEFYIIIEF